MFQVLNSEVAVAEYIMFENEQLSKVAFNVSKRLGVFPLWNISGKCTTQTHKHRERERMVLILNETMLFFKCDC
jgi:hypothetical protein